MTLRALTLWPEWAWAICHLDKRIENRSWSPTRVGLKAGDWFAIHAGKYIGGRRGRPATIGGLAAVGEMAANAGWRPHLFGRALMCTRLGAAPSSEDPTLIPTFCPSSAVVAVVRLGSYGPGLALDTSGWAVPGSWRWHLNEVCVLPRPVPCGGHQGLWTMPPDVLAAVSAQWSPS